jgi:hypothetical protein
LLLSSGVVRELSDISLGFKGAALHLGYPPITHRLPLKQRLPSPKMELPYEKYQ